MVRSALSRKGDEGQRKKENMKMIIDLILSSYAAHTAANMPSHPPAPLPPPPLKEGGGGVAKAELK